MRRRCCCRWGRWGSTSIWSSRSSAADLSTAALGSRRHLLRRAGLPWRTGRRLGIRLSIVSVGHRRNSGRRGIDGLLPITGEI